MMRGSCRKSSCVCSITGAARGTPTLPITISKAITAPMTTIASIHALMLGGNLICSSRIHRKDVSGWDRCESEGLHTRMQKSICVQRPGPSYENARRHDLAGAPSSSGGESSLRADMIFGMDRGRSSGPRRPRACLGGCYPSSRSAFLPSRLTSPGLIPGPTNSFPDTSATASASSPSFTGTLLRTNSMAPSLSDSYARKFRTIRGFPSESKVVTRMFHPAGILMRRNCRRSMTCLIQTDLVRHRGLIIPGLSPNESNAD